MTEMHPINQTQSLIQTIMHLDTIPNVPYFPQKISRVVREITQSYSGFEIAEDHLAIYINYYKSKYSKRIIIDTHLDHPGFIKNNNDMCVGLGSIGSPYKIDQMNSFAPIPVRFFSHGGDFLGDGDLTDFWFEQGRLNARYTCGSKAQDLPLNTQILPRLDPYLADNSIYLRSADNLAVTSVALELIKWIAENNLEINITFIFTKLEEIRQISASHIATKRSTPFGPIDENTYIVVLEAATVGQTESTRTISEVVTNYDSGIIVRIADSQLVYKVGEQENYAESLALHAINATNSSFQHGPLLSNCDATPYVLFSGCPNIIGLTVPCKNKHNINSQGKFTHESVLLDDLSVLRDTLRNMLGLINTEFSPHPHRLINPRNEYKGNQSAVLRKQKSQWWRTAIWAEPRLRAEHLHPQNMNEWTVFTVAAAKARLWF